MYVINSQIALFNPLFYHTSDYLINVLDPIVNGRQYFFGEFFHCCLISVSSDFNISSPELVHLSHGI